MKLRINPRNHLQNRQTTGKWLANKRVEDKGEIKTNTDDDYQQCYCLRKALNTVSVVWPKYNNGSITKIAYMSLMTNDNGLASGIIKGLNPHHGRCLEIYYVAGDRHGHKHMTSSRRGTCTLLDSQLNNFGSKHSKVLNPPPSCVHFCWHL